MRERWKVKACALALLALGVGGCRSETTPAPDAAAPVTPPTVAPGVEDVVTPAVDTVAAAAADTAAPWPVVAQPTVTLLDAGVEPRAPLRLRPVVGAVETTTIALAMKARTTLGGREVPAQALPGARLVLEVKVEAVDADGVASWRATVREATLEERPDATAAVIGQLREGLAAVRGLELAGRVSDRGVTTVGGFARPPAEGPLVALLSGFRESLLQLAVPLPEEAVGVGARWQVEQIVAQGGMKIRQATVFDLVSVEGARVVARVTLTQEAQDGGAGAEALPQGARLEAFSGRGTGDTTLELTRILPLTSAAQVATQVRMAVPAPDGGTQALEMTMDIALSLWEGVGAGGGAEVPEVPEVPDTPKTPEGAP